MAKTANPKDRNLSDRTGSYIQARDGHNARPSGGKTRGRTIDYQELEDVDLLALIVKEEKKALEALYARYSTAVYSLSVQMLRDSEAAEEVTQDAFFNVWRRASSYKSGRGNVSSWLFSIAHHRAIDEIRKRKRHRQMQVPGVVDIENQPSDDTTDPVRYTTVQFQRGEIEEALVNLGTDQRNVVVLAYYGGLTHSEIAAKLEQPLGTVKTRMRLALKKLREVMAPPVEE